jgi:hypothetical protein
LFYEDDSKAHEGGETAKKEGGHRNTNSATPSQARPPGNKKFLEKENNYGY